MEIFVNKMCAKYEISTALRLYLMTFSNLFRTFLTLTSSVVPAEISALIAQTDVELLHESRRGGATDVRTAVVPTAHINCRGQTFIDTCTQNYKYRQTLLSLIQWD